MHRHEGFAPVSCKQGLESLVPTSPYYLKSGKFLQNVLAMQLDNGECLIAATYLLSCQLHS